MTHDDAQAIADRFGVSAVAVRANLRQMAVALAADPGADLDGVATGFDEQSRAFEARYYDDVSGYTGFRDGLRRAVAHEAYSLIREAVKPVETKEA